MRRQWYVIGPEHEFSTFDSPKEAQKYAEDLLDHYRDIAPDDGWHEEIGILQWGELLPKEVAKIEEVPGPELDEGEIPKFGEYWDVSLCKPRVVR